jgi:hypothetical protein
MNSVSTSLTDDCTIDASGGINSLGNGELIEKGFCWKVDGKPTLEDCDGHIAVTGGSEDSYSASITGLHYNSTYYICAYAKTGADDETYTSYSSSSTCDTKSISISYSTSLSDDYIEISMSCDDNYEDNITEWSAAIVREGNTKITLDDNSYTSAKIDSDTNKYVVKFTGLTNSSTYVIRMRAQYNNEYYIYQDTGNINLLRGPSKGDIDNPDIK